MSVRIDGKARKRPSHIGQFAVFLNCVQLRQNRIPVGNGLGRRRLHEIEFTHVAELQRLHAKNHGCQIGAHDFRIGIVGPSCPVVFRMQMPSATRPQRPAR